MSLDPGSLRTRSVADLVHLARSYNIENASSLRKPDLVAAILRAASAGGPAEAGGVLEILPDGFGFLRAPEYSFLPGPDDVYVSPSQIRRFNLRTGDTVTGTVRAPKENERYFALIKVGTVNGVDPEAGRDKLLFENLTAEQPRRRLFARLDKDGPVGAASRLLDLACPFAAGQRGLVVGPARSGKSLVLQALAEGLVAREPEVVVLYVLVAERPEDVTELEQALPVEVLASTFDEPDNRHVQVAEIAVERAKRLVEQRKDVVLLFDSLTRLVRAANTVVTATGRTAAGVDVAAVQRARRVLGAARAVQEGGSLTVFATLQLDPGSRADEQLWDELRGPENLLVRTCREVPTAGLPLCLDLTETGTTRVERFLPAEDQARRRAWRAEVGGDWQVAVRSVLGGEAP